MSLQMNAVNLLPNHSCEHDGTCRDRLSSRRESNETVHTNSYASRFRKKRQSVPLSIGSSSVVLERYLKKRESIAAQLAVENLRTSVNADPFRYNFQTKQGPSIENKRKRGCKAVYHYFSYMNKKFGLRHIFLLLALICYALVGGVIFNTIESVREKEDLNILHELLVQRISNISEELVSVMFNTNETDLQFEVSSIIRDFYKDMLDLERKLKGSVFDKIDNGEQMWDYWSAVFYSATLFTTVGYGTIACASALGKAITIIYAVIGIPLMLVVINDLGRVLFYALQKLYNNIYRMFRFWQVSKVLWTKVGITIAQGYYFLKTMSSTIGKMSSNINCIDKFVGTVLPSPSFRRTGFCKKVDKNDTVDETFPLRVAVPLVFVYLLICAVVIHICDNEQGNQDEDGLNFGDSFYFSFISIATIGLGDVMPVHIKNSPLVAAMFMFGLVLFSVIMSTVYARVERKYFHAMEVLEEALEELYAEELEEMEDETRGQRVLRNMSDALTARDIELENEAARRKLSRIAKSVCSSRMSSRHSLSTIGRRRRGPSCASNDINSLMPALGAIGFNSDIVREIKELDHPKDIVRANLANSMSKSCSDTNLFFHRPRRFSLIPRRSRRVHPELGMQCDATNKSCIF